MPGDREAVCAAKAIEPRVELAFAKLDDLMALGTRQVVVMLISAEPVADLAWAVHERVNDAVTAQQAEGTVDGREADRDASCSQRFENLLGSRVVRLGLERLEDLEPLASGADPTRG
jgi:hypothetical protein